MICPFATRLLRKAMEKVAGQLKLPLLVGASATVISQVEKSQPDVLHVKQRGLPTEALFVSRARHQAVIVVAGPQSGRLSMICWHELPGMNYPTAVPQSASCAPLSSCTT